MDLTKIKGFIRKELGKRGTTVTSLCEKLEIKDYELLGVVELLKQEGLLVEVINGQVVKTTAKEVEPFVYELPLNTNKFKFMAISDVHYGSLWNRPDLVKLCYQLAEKEKCDFVTNSGDLFEGEYKNRPNHVYEVHKHGLEQQLEYIAKVYPKSDIPTYFITGNHEASLVKQTSCNPGKMLAKERPDLIYLGADLGDLKVNNVNIRLRHGGGGNAYALSYKLQKYFETIPAGDKTKIVLQGHFHFSAFMKYRDKYGINVPALQDYTPYAKSLGLPAEMGAWLIEVEADKKGEILSITPKLHSFPSKEKVKSLTLKK